jgi:hypothetical protein
MLASYELVQPAATAKVTAGWNAPDPCVPGPSGPAQFTLKLRHAYVDDVEADGLAVAAGVGADPPVPLDLPGNRL